MNSATSNPNLDLTLRAISVFATGSGSTINDANVWLTSFERTSDAWQVAIELIHGGRDMDPVSSANNQFWGLKILYSKVKRDFHQIDIGNMHLFIHYFDRFTNNSLAYLPNYFL